jgi:hypothetical protein
VGGVTPKRGLLRRAGRLLDHLVGAGKDPLRDCQGECLGGLQVDHQLKYGRLLDRQIGRLGAVEDLPA